MQKNGLRKNPLSLKSLSPQETFSLGQWLAKQSTPGVVMLLEGSLGAGKTTFAKGLISQLSGVPPEEITSPTFQWVRSYPSRNSEIKEIHHFDLYQLTDPQQFIQKGFLEYLDSTTLCCIEWADKIKHLISVGLYQIIFDLSEEETRNISIQWIPTP